MRSETLPTVTPSTARERVGDPLGVVGVAGRARHVDAQPVAPSRVDVEGGDHPAGRLDGGRELARREPACGTSSRTVIEYETLGISPTGRHYAWRLGRRAGGGVTP